LNLPHGNIPSTSAPLDSEAPNRHLKDATTGGDAKHIAMLDEASNVRIDLDQSEGIGLAY